MTLVQQLEAIRTQQGRATAHPYADIPCKETSDAALLCKNPVVSIMVLAYNHTKYIRECLDSLVCQQTNFEYEILIGEDCSTDNTREICFEYQKCYPDKVRVLWSDENLYSYGGNELRVRYKSRGEFVAYCEGDDYWTDPLKLQKQVDFIRAKDAVMCVAFTDWVYPDHVVHSTYEPKEYITTEDLKRHYFHTTTYLMRRDVFMSLDQRFPRMRGLIDVQIEFCMVDDGKVCLLPETVSVYRESGDGIASSLDVATRPYFGTKLFFELYCHGPQKERAYFADKIFTWLDAPFVVNRAYRPTLMPVVGAWRLFAAHLYLSRVVGRRASYNFKYMASLMWYILRVSLVKLGLGKMFRPLPKE